MSNLHVPGIVFPNYSSTKTLLENAVDATKSGSTLRNVGAHTVTPMISVASTALDAVAQFFALVTTTATFSARMVVKLASFNSVDFAEENTLSRMGQHARNSIGWTAMVLVVPALTVLSPDTALNTLKGMGLVESAGKIDTANFWDAFKNAAGVKGKLKVLRDQPKVTAKAISSLPFQAASSVGQKLGAQAKAHPYAATAVGVVAPVAVAIDELVAWYRDQGDSVSRHGLLKVYENLGWQGVETAQSAMYGAWNMLPSMPTFGFGASDASNHLKETVDHLKKSGESAKETIKDVMKDAKENAEDVVNNVKGSAEDAAQSLKYGVHTGFVEGAEKTV